LNSIVYIESLKDYIQIHLDNDDTSIVTKYTLSDIEKELIDYNFLRVHRSFIINTTKITAFSTNEIDLSHSKEVPIGASYKDSILVFLENLKK
jgi:DNA-binding LytR/AlgR family response regulator